MLLSDAAEWSMWRVIPAPEASQRSEDQEVVKPVVVIAVPVQPLGRVAPTFLGPLGLRASRVEAWWQLPVLLGVKVPAATFQAGKLPWSHAPGTRPLVSDAWTRAVGCLGVSMNRWGHADCTSDPLEGLAMIAWRNRRREGERLPAGQGRHKR
jgi:hypothetical protein